MPFLLRLYSFLAALKYPILQIESLWTKKINQDILAKR